MLVEPIMSSFGSLELFQAGTQEGAPWPKAARSHAGVGVSGCRDVAESSVLRALAVLSTKRFGACV